ncbi:membrane protein [Pectobacterium bacteriophage PM2]|uniref:Uncharacterized protein n=1 Tax=Pectobacterium bacteriophage PM2 TaxID=1429794 RepID=A0A0A0PZG8_9CAUD|nr:membrane protein [Pectobacterium bacteriophage PM2]AHY25069.1 hypothetical protein PM2_107 [Pectobacterium bacteriophage PM2]
MNINTKSWHYRLISAITFRDSRRGKVPTSLCPYFRAVVYRIAFIIATTSIGGFILGLFGEGAAVYLSSLAGITMGPVASIIAGIPFGIILFAFIIGTVYGLLMGLSKIVGKIVVAYEDYQDKKLDKEIEDRKNGVKPKEPGLIMSFIKSNHDKVCPTLTFISKEEK